MPTKLALASFYTLGLLSSFLIVIILVIMYFTGAINAVWLIGLTIGLNLFFWLIGPYITDLMNKIFYKMHFYSWPEIQQMNPGLADFIAKTAANNKISLPKIGIIEDENPTAYTYGSGAFNARIIFTQGILTYLSSEEVEAVIAHELGHIVHKDFIVMAIANTIVQLLYEISQIFLKTRSKNSGSDKKGGGIFFFIGLASWVFYIIGFYVMLYLSRLREYYADEFSARTTGKPYLLANALIKIAYGIMAAGKEKKSERLLRLYLKRFTLLMINLL